MHENKKSTDHVVETMEVESPPIRKNIVRYIATFTGIAFAIIGVLFMVSIILFIPGIFAVLVGMVMAVIFVPKASVECPKCGTDSKVNLNAKSLKCEGCGTQTPLKWGGKGSWMTKSFSQLAKERKERKRNQR